MPTDYQFVHEQRNGRDSVRIVISQRIGYLEPNQVRDAVLTRLAAAGRGGRMTGELWAAGNVLTVERGEPAATAGAKIPPVRFTSD